ncbi:MAG: DNA polymerase III subunit epsilon, partial [Ancrocorticia sp.]|nr:DNA polymerase III subunit epsilon [Ancrocorticia sp.]
GKCAGPCIGAGSDTAAVSCVQDILAGNCDTVWDAQIERLGMLASQERFEQAATERDRLAALMSVAQRRERLLPLLTAREIIATAREKHGWEISVIRYGRLMGTAICEKGEEPPDVAQRLAESCPVLQRPETAGGAAHIEESEILLKWLWRPNTRLLKWDGERPLALARRSPARRQVPRQIPLPALN